MSMMGRPPFTVRDEVGGGSRDAHLAALTDDSRTS
jgi:hypothetical protein